MRHRANTWWAGVVNVLWSGLTTLFVVALFVGSTVSAWARPVEGFNSPLDIKCESTSQCSGIVRGEYTLGRYTGILLTKRGGGSVAVSTERNGGVLRFELTESSPVVLTLTWDGDQHPDQLSGAGLNCLDLTQGGAYAFVISDMSIESECRGDSRGQACPNFQIESRIYDAKDPTGQRYSVSMMTRSLPDKTDVVIPFSNFIREGPRGKGNISCVGAVSISLRFEEFESVELELGAIYTNGSEAMTPVPTPTAEITSTAPPSPSAEISATVPQVMTAAIESPEPVLSTPEIGGVSDLDTPTVVATGVPLVTAAVAPRMPAATEDEEVTYGQLVEED